MSISRSIVDAVRSLDPPGRFLEKNPYTGLWSDIGHRKAIEKTSQALRDGAAMLRRQLSADFGDPDFLSAVFGDNNQSPDATNEENDAKPPDSDGATENRMDLTDAEPKSSKAAKKLRDAKPVSPHPFAIAFLAPIHSRLHFETTAA